MMRTSPNISPAYKNTPSPQRGFSVLEPWWSDGDSNPGPSACKADALPTELPPQSKGKRQKVKVEGGITLFYLLPFAFLLLGLVGVGGLEPPTSIYQDRALTN